MDQPISIRLYPAPIATPKEDSKSYKSRSSAYILEMNLSLLTGLPFLPWAFRGVSVHISLTFSSTMLQCLSKALTLASSFLLFRHDIKTWVCERTAVWRMESGPALNSCSSRSEISYSLDERQSRNISDVNVRELSARLVLKFPVQGQYLRR
jgi:hypothetical protein